MPTSKILVPEIPQITDWGWGVLLLLSFLLFVIFVLWYCVDMQKQIRKLEDENEQLREVLRTHADL